MCLNLLFYSRLQNAKNAKEMRRAQGLRFEIFNLELTIWLKG